MGVNMKGIEDLKSSLGCLNNTRDELIAKIAKELATRLLRSVVKRTPVSNGNYYVEVAETYDAKTGKSKVYKYTSGKNKGKAKIKRTKITGGTLRRGWTVDDKTLMFGDTYVINVFNNIFYCTYVENGHRQTPGRYVPAIGKRLKKSWVPGKHMLKLSVDDLQKKADAIVEKRVKKWLNEVMQ